MSIYTASGRGSTPPDGAADQSAVVEPARALGLVVIRESDEHNVELFNGMREQTYRAYGRVTALEAIRAVGMLPLNCAGSFTVSEDEGGRTIEQVVLVEPVRYGGTKAILFYYRGYWHLWSQSSAARVSMDGVNEFTEILIEVLTRVRPKTLYAANISRLVRSQRQAYALRPALCDNVDEILAGAMRFDLSGSDGVVGMLLLDVLAMASAMERDWIVQRMICGKIGKWRRGEWPFGPSAVPFGYKLDRHTRKLVPELHLRPAVREMLVILAGDAPPAEMQRQLAAAGVLTARKNRVLGRRAGVDALQGPAALVNSLYSWAGVWVSGEFLHRLTNGFQHVDDLNGVPVVRSGPKDPGELQMLVMLPVPDGGWAEPEILRAFQARAVQRAASLVRNGKSSQRPLSAAVVAASTNDTLHAAILNKVRAMGQDAAAKMRHSAGRARRMISPLAGREWSDGQFDFALQPTTKDVYRLFCWPSNEERGPLNWWSNAQADQTAPKDDR